MRLYRISLLMFSILGAALCQSANDDTLGYKLVPDWPNDARTAAGTPAGPWNLIQAPGVAVDSRGHVLVLHRGAHPILEFESGGKFVRSWGDGIMGGWRLRSGSRFGGRTVLSSDRATRVTRRSRRGEEYRAHDSR